MHIQLHGKKLFLCIALIMCVPKPVKQSLKCQC